MKKYPPMLFYKGDLSLLKRKKISIIGTRHPNQYTKSFTISLASKLAKKGIVIVSGAAMGVDALAHSGAGAKNTIAIMPNGLDLKYPSVNKTLIEKIEDEGLTISQFNADFKATPWSFVVRNEVVVALGEILIVTQADLNSGSMRSVEYALDMKKEIYVLPHRIGESEGTNMLLRDGKAKAIYDIDEFVNSFEDDVTLESSDLLMEYFKTSPTFDEAIAKFSDRVYEYELDGKIEIINGKIVIL